MLNPLLLLLLFTLCCAAADHSFKTLLYGEKLKGYLKVSSAGGDKYVVQFKIEEMLVDGVTWSLHSSSAPYDLAVMTDNCRRCKKSPHIVREQPLEDTTLTAAQLVGHTIVLGTANEVLACATVLLPELPLLQASFQKHPIHGHIHVVPLKDQLRILPDLRYDADYEASDPAEEVIDWAFVSDCSQNNVLQNSDGTELGVDSRTTLTFETSGVNISLVNFEIFRGGKPFACAPLQHFEPRILKSDNITLSQAHLYHPVHASVVPQEVRIRDDCLDLATEAIHFPFDHFFPSMSIFGPDTVMLKSVVNTDNSCSVLRPQFPLPAATTVLSYPISGRITVVDSEDVMLLTGSLRHLFDEQATRATVQISPKPAPAGSCPQYLEECSECYTLPDAAIIVGRNESEVALSGVLPHFVLSEMRSIIIDMQWTKVCANLTQLPSGALTARASIRRYSPVSAPVVASVILLEFPASNYTEVVVERKRALSEVSTHTRPIDMSITGGPPCGELTIGPKKTVSWVNQLIDDDNSTEHTASFLIDEPLVSGPHSVLGTSLLFSEKQEVFCGHFDINEEKQSAIVKFNSTFSGFVRLTQFGSNPSVGIPTLVSYNLHLVDKDLHSPTSANWSIVNMENMTCANALLYNPTAINSSDNSRIVGNVGARAGKLQLDKRWLVAVRDVPLSGAFAVLGRSLRVCVDEECECAEIMPVKEASFRWIVPSKSSLSELQREVANRTGITTQQIQIDYNRELHGARCSIYRITITESDDKLSEVLSNFDVGNKKFADDPVADCGAEGASSEPAGGTVKSSTLPSSILLFICTMIMLLNH